VDERSPSRACSPDEVLHTGGTGLTAGRAGESLDKSGQIQLGSSTTDGQSGARGSPRREGAPDTEAGPELRLVVTEAGRGEAEGVVDLLFVRSDGVQLVSGIFLPADRAPGHRGIIVRLALNILLQALLYLHRLLVLVVVDDEEVLAVGVDRLLGKYLTSHRSAGSLLRDSPGSGLEQGGLGSSSAQVTVEYFLLDESVLSQIMVHTLTVRIV